MTTWKDTRTELEKRADIEAEASRMKPEVLDPESVPTPPSYGD